VKVPQLCHPEHRELRTTCAIFSTRDTPTSKYPVSTGNVILGLFARLVASPSDFRAGGKAHLEQVTGKDASVNCVHHLTCDGMQQEGKAERLVRGRILLVNTQAGSS